MSGIMILVALAVGLALGAAVWAFRSRRRREASGMDPEHPTRTEAGREARRE